MFDNFPYFINGNTIGDNTIFKCNGINIQTKFLPEFN